MDARETRSGPRWARLLSETHCDALDRCHSRSPEHEQRSDDGGHDVAQRDEPICRARAAAKDMRKMNPPTSAPARPTAKYRRNPKPLRSQVMISPARLPPSGQQRSKPRFDRATASSYAVIMAQRRIGRRRPRQSGAMASLPPGPEIQRRSLRFSGNRPTDAVANYRGLS